MARKKAKKSKSSSLRFDQKLVLNQWMLSLFQVDSFDKLAEHLKPLELEGLDDNNVHRFLHQMRLLWEYEAFPGETLLAYDQNIVKHTRALSEQRGETLRWKYFQYLSLLFTEIYLDRLFTYPEKLRDDLNEHVAKFNEDKPDKEKLPPYELDDLLKIAFWNATGSGKTLLMHINLLQYQHYMRVHKKTKELNRIILLTPNEGLSNQHLDEFAKSGIFAQAFKKERSGEARAALGLVSKPIDVIEVTKLKEEMGQKTVAIVAFEDGNLVLVDEGHRGASSSVEGAWMSARNQLCENGFSFEYSATFGQAMKGKKSLEAIYARNILFDYSYRYFYRDGFGKDYRILNLADDTDEERRRLYLMACLLGFYQQQKLYGENPNAFRPFLLEKPLWVFVGGSVNAVRSQNKRKVSDVVDILLALAEFVKNKSNTVQLIDRLLSGKPGLLDQRGHEIFATAFPYLTSLKSSAESIFDDILWSVFRAKSPAIIHVDHLKGTDGEISLSLGNNDPFGLINVGDAANLCKLCEEHGELLKVDGKDFSDSLFRSINESDSDINILIGSKKFTEGWNSWRVSTMGLMNIGKSEGSEIIQLFGRGVRLKGHGMTLKRSSQLPGVKRPEHIGLLETLNIFGIRAQYMQQFKEYLEDEGLPTNEDRIEFILPVIKNLDGKKLTSIRLKENVDFKRQGEKPTLDEPPAFLLKHPVSLNWYPKIQSRQSRGVRSSGEAVEMHEGKLEEKHSAFMDVDSIYYELQHFKNERAWYNLNLPRESVMKLLGNPDWYNLYIPEAELEFNNFEQVRRWEEIAVALLKKYIDRYYKHKKQEWEADHLEYHELQEDDPNFVEEYRLLVDESADNIKDGLEALKQDLAQDSFRTQCEVDKLSAYWFGNHLYQPLLHLSQTQLIEVSPVALNDGERDFVLHLKGFLETQPALLKDKELYLLRNVSKRGIGFFEAGNFYPDFILWLLDGKKQYVNFVDPKGLRNLDGGSSNPKIQFYKTIKEIENRLADPNVVLNSFIVSATPHENIPMWGEGMTKQEMNACHVLFQTDQDTYIQSLLKMALADS